MSSNPGLDANVALLARMVDLLGDVADSLVLVGGCATGLLLTAIRAHGVRPTFDVDVVAKVTTIREYHALAIACKKIREGAWSTPFRMPVDWSWKRALPELCSAAGQY